MPQKIWLPHCTYMSQYTTTIVLYTETILLHILVKNNKLQHFLPVIVIYVPAINMPIYATHHMQQWGNYTNIYATYQIGAINGMVKNVVHK